MPPRKRTNRKYDYDDILDRIVEFKENRGGNSPSLRKICEICNISSTSVANYILSELELEGKLMVTEDGIELPGYAYIRVEGV